MPAAFVGLHSSMAIGGGGPLVVTVDPGLVIAGGMPPVAGGSVSTDVPDGGATMPVLPPAALPPPVGAVVAPPLSIGVILLPPVFAEHAAAPSVQRTIAAFAVIRCAFIDVS